jgi:hypothetical protein
MVSKKTTGKKGRRSKANTRTPVQPAPRQIQELIVPPQSVSLPVEITPMPSQLVVQPSQTEASAAGRLAQQPKAVETTVVDQTAVKQTS